MALTFTLGIDSSTEVTLPPEYDYQAPTVKIDSRFRSKSGKLYTYKWGDYDKFDFSVQYLSNSSAAIVNSWWSTDTELLFFVASDNGNTEVSSVMIQNKSEPFTEFQPPYIEYKKGKILLETY